MLTLSKTHAVEEFHGSNCIYFLTLHMSCSEVLVRQHSFKKLEKLYSEFVCLTSHLSFGQINAVDYFSDATVNTVSKDFQYFKDCILSQNYTQKRY